MWCGITSEAIKEETDAVAVGGANDVAVSEQRREAVVEGYGGEVKRRCFAEADGEDEEYEAIRQNTSSGYCPKTT